MIDLKKPVEKKLLSEQAWIELWDGVRVRIDYLTRAQETELRRLRAMWRAKIADPNGDHFLEYYIRAAVKEAVGFGIEGETARIESSGGLAMNLVTSPQDADKSLRIDITEAFAQLGALEALCGAISERLNFDEVEKKSVSSPPSSLSAESSKVSGSTSSPAQES
jgi:hypothetical protein